MRSYMHRHIVFLYDGLVHNGVLPGDIRKGPGGLNPRLLFAFSALAAVNAEIDKMKD